MTEIFAAKSMDNFDELLKQGLELLDRGTCTEALSIFERCLVQEPQSVRYLYAIGVAYYHIEQYETGLKYFCQALEIQPQHVPLLAWRGMTYGELQQEAEAKVDFQACCEIVPQDAEDWRGRGLALDNLEQYKDAIKSFDQAIALRPDYRSAWLNRGTSLNNLGQYEDAIKSYDQAIALKSDYYAAWFNRGYSLHNLGQYEDAIQSYDQAIALKPADYSAWYNRGCSLANLRQYEDAIQSYDQAIALKPNYYSAWFNRGCSLANLRQYEDAIQSYDQAIALKPADHAAWNGRGNSLYNLKQYEEAIASYNEAISHSQGQNWRAWESKGQSTLNFYQDTELAITIWDEGIQALLRNSSEFSYGRAMLHRRKAEILYNSGQNQPSPFQNWFRARDNYKQAINLLPLLDYPKLHLELWQNFLKVCQQLGDQRTIKAALQEASAKLQRLLDDPERPLGEKISLERRFESFKQIQIDYLAQQDPIEAIELAETNKNCCLWRLREDWKAKTPATSYTDIQSLLNETTAAIYWHQSPAAITTFILRHNRLPTILALTPPKAPSLQPGQQPYPATAHQLAQFETWLQQWTALYQNYNYENGENDPWRQEMEFLLFTRLRKILEIKCLCEALQGIQTLILIPHRDLHLLPLQALFPSKFRCTTLPSARLALDHLPLPTPYSPTLTSIEDPPTHYTKRQSKTPQKMLYAELESTLISTFFPTQSLAATQATRSALQTHLTQPADLFHFTGHAYHNFDDPLDSALALAGTELLTLRDIFQLNLNPYRLVCLSACETGLTRQRDLTDEYVGLVAGFLKAGANFVISTLWIVDEISSALFMIRLYENLSRSLSPINAFHESQSWLKSDYATLIPWYDALSQRLPRYNGHTETLRDAAHLARQDAALKGTSHRPFEHPYHWAGFVITGYESTSP